MVERDVAVFVGNGAAQQCDIEGEALVEQVVLAVELDELGCIVGGLLVHAAAFETGVDERAQADLGEQTGATCRNLTPEVDDDALRQAMALDLALLDLLAQSERGTDMRRRPARHQTGPRLAKHRDAAGLPVAHGAALFQVDVAGVPRFLETIAHRAGDFFCPSGKPHAGDANRRAIGNEFCRTLSCNKLGHIRHPPRIPNDAYTLYSSGIEQGASRKRLLIFCAACHMSSRGVVP